MSIEREVMQAEERIRPYVRETPFRVSPGLSDRTGWEVWVKEEQHQHTGSFKARGAFSKLLTLNADDRSRGVVTASSGNHGAAVSYAAALLGVRAQVFVPQTASPAKVAKIRDRGADVVVFGTDGLDTELEARRVAGESGAVFVSPYNDWEVMAGQGSLAVEIHRQGPAPDRLYVAVGGGGMIGGISAHLRAVAPLVQVIGVLPANSPVMAESVKAGRIVDMASQPTLSDGTAGGVEQGSVTFEICRRFVHEWTTVTEEEIATAMRAWSAYEPGMIEGAAGVALAAMLRDAKSGPTQRVAVVICGGNVTADRWTAVVGV
jgi:threonine dehydratase